MKFYPAAVLSNLCVFGNTYACKPPTRVNDSSFMYASAVGHLEVLAGSYVLKVGSLHTRCDSGTITRLMSTGRPQGKSKYLYHLMFSTQQAICLMMGPDVAAALAFLSQPQGEEASSVGSL